MSAYVYCPQCRVNMVPPTVSRCGECEVAERVEESAAEHIAALEARVRRLKEALGWAMGFVSKPTRRLKQNAAHCDAYERAVALLKEAQP